MNIKSTALLSIFSILFGTAYADIAKNSRPANQNPLIVVLLMVRDEELVIEKTLESFIPDSVRYGFDTGEIAYILYDTGSTDTTIEKTEALFKKYGLHHTVIAKDTWIDYAASRNKALETARTAYPQSTFILFPDAEWYLHGIDDLIEFCKKEKAAYDAGTTCPPPYYRTRMIKPGVYISLTGRLFLTADDVHFSKTDDIHECPNKCSGLSTPESVYFEIGVSKEGSERSAARWHRDKERLLKRVARDPQDVRAVSYLGKTLQWLGENKDAYIFLKKRKELHSFPEEDYECLYHLAEVTEILSHDDPTNYTWQEALSYYLEAYSMRPHRAECLVRLAMHYLEAHQFGLSYIFAKRATELPLPNAEREILPISLYMYDFKRWEILSRAAWYVEEYAVGEAAAQKAIEAQPNVPYLYKNLSYYWEHKNSVGAIA